MERWIVLGIVALVLTIGAIRIGLATMRTRRQVAEKRRIAEEKGSAARDQALAEKAAQRTAAVARGEKAALQDLLASARSQFSGDWVQEAARQLVTAEQPAARGFLAETIRSTGADGLHRALRTHGLEDLLPAVIEACTRKPSIALFETIGALSAARGVTLRHPGDRRKLRLMYECNALAFIAEQSGGLATDGHGRIMDIMPTALHQRVPFYVGSRKMVEKASSFTD